MSAVLTPLRRRRVVALLSCVLCSLLLCAVAGKATGGWALGDEELAGPCALAHESLWKLELEAFKERYRDSAPFLYTSLPDNQPFTRGAARDALLASLGGREVWAEGVALPLKEYLAGSGGGARVARTATLRAILASGEHKLGKKGWARFLRRYSHNGRFFMVSKGDALNATVLVSRADATSNFARSPHSRWLETVHGRVRAALLPPGSPTPTPPPAGGAAWLDSLPQKGLLDCTFGPGTALYVPPGWWAAELAVDEGLAVMASVEYTDVVAEFDPSSLIGQMEQAGGASSHDEL